MNKQLLILSISVTILILNALCTSGCESAKYANMTPGEKLYNRKCSSCHRLKSPVEYSDEEWIEYVHEYGRRTSETKKQLIIDYLQKANDPIIADPNNTLATVVLHSATPTD